MRCAHVVVVVNGEFAHDDRLLPIVDEAAGVIAADGGANWLMAHGRSPHRLVGDLDSVSAEVLALLESAGCEIERHAGDKDETDTELALVAALGMGADRLTILGALGGRIDHELANVLLLAMPRMASVEVVIFDGTSYLSMARKRQRICGEVGDMVSLIPVAGDAEGIVTQGLAYPLRDEALTFGLARGVSNVMVEPQALVVLRRGLLLVVRTPKRYLEEGNDG